MNNIIEKLSQILEDNKTKLTSLAASTPEYNKNLDQLDGSNLDPPTIHPRDYLVDLLTEWSHQFLETCRELQTNSHSHERCKGIIRWDDFLDKTSRADDASVTDQSESSLEELTMRYKSLVLTLENQLEETKKEVVDLQKSLDLPNLDEDKIEGALSNVQSLGKESLSKTPCWKSQPGEVNSHELGQLQSTSSFTALPKLQKSRPLMFISKARINEHFAEVNKTENKKVCSECGQTRERNEMKSARHQQGESNAHEAERLRLSSSIEILTKQLNAEHSRNKIFGSINSGLVELNRTQTSQVRKLKEQVRLLQYRLIDKSKETIKVHKALRRATKAMNLNRKQCENLRSKLERCRKNLSRYCVEDMTSWKGRT